MYLRFSRVTQSEPGECAFYRAVCPVLNSIRNWLFTIQNVTNCLQLIFARMFILSSSLFGFVSLSCSLIHLQVLAGRDNCGGFLLKKRHRLTSAPGTGRQEKKKEEHWWSLILLSSHPSVYANWPSVSALSPLLFSSPCPLSCLLVANAKQMCRVHHSRQVMIEKERKKYKDTGEKRKWSLDKLYISPI